jgi:8-oxo-dGTP pyrophosphatase MutT (NUDIX family)
MLQPRLAATAIVARPAPDGMQVYLTRRSARSAFAPDAFVFPGGAVDPADYDSHVQTRVNGIDEQRVRRAFRAERSADLPSTEPDIDAASARALFVTALRELFEETGILLTRTAAGDEREESVDAEDPERATVRDDARAFATVLERRDAFADATRLTLFSHWITPPSEGRRFNTHFFVAAVAGDRSGFADASETHDGVWLSPAVALQRYRDGAMHLVYPTIKHLERLGGIDSVDELQRFARSKAVVTILPTGEPGRFELPPTLENAW